MDARRCHDLGRALFLIFLGLPTALAWALALAGIPLLDVAAVWLLHAALSRSYIRSHPAAEAASPSLEITLAVGRRMPGGLTPSWSRAFAARTWSRHRLAER